jgi:thiol-disulfide isomerase/thioredoxin
VRNPGGCVPVRLGLPVLLGQSVLLGLLALGTAGTPPTPPAPPAGLDALDGYRAVDLDGRRWTRDDLAGRVVMVDFWATWCAPCLAELPRLRQAHRRWGGRELVIVGVAVDRTEARLLRRCLVRHEVGWPQIHDRRGLAAPLPRRFGVEAVPRNFLFGRDGRLLAMDLRGEALTQTLEDLLGDQAPLAQRPSAPLSAPSLSAPTR